VDHQAKPGDEEYGRAFTSNTAANGKPPASAHSSQGQSANPPHRAARGIGIYSDFANQLSRNYFLTRRTSPPVIPDGKGLQIYDSATTVSDPKSRDLAATPIPGFWIARFAGRETGGFRAHL